jgi:hypothetical protein
MNVSSILRRRVSYLHSLNRPLHENLLNHIILIARPELILQHTLARTIHLALSTVLVRGHDLEGADDLRHWDRLVGLPCLEVFGGIDEDYEIVFFAFVVDFAYFGVSAGHGCDRSGLFLVEWLV